MTIHHGENPTKQLAELLTVAYYRAVPPLGGLSTWAECLEGDLKLYFEVGIPPPALYRKRFRTSVDERQFVPYIRERAKMPRARLEGSTKLDALIINPDNGFSIAF